MERRIPMSEKELDRISIFEAILAKRLKIPKAAKHLGLSTRQVKRLKKRFKAEGPKGLVSKKVGAQGNRRVPTGQKELVINFLNQKDHSDFGPTLAHEYLREEGYLTISVSVVRKIMIQNGLWVSKRARELKVHPLRPRRSRMGELIQLDGSEHDWFEGRGPRCSLLVFIDDATSETMHLKFVKSENTLDYFEATREYIEKHGRPEAFYPDKHGVFRVNHEGALSGDGKTQFGRALDELDIDLICANTPQAKGRVERRNRDFQNRLIKAMRIAKICDIEAANAFVPSFLKRFNQKFAKAPKDPHNAHRPVLPTQNLDRIFCLKEQRRLSKNLTLQYKNVIYQVFADRREYTLRKAEVMVLETRGGAILIEHRGKQLTAIPYHQMQARAEECSGKELMAKLTEKAEIKRERKQSRKHPWKRGPRGFTQKLREQACCY